MNVLKVLIPFNFTTLPGSQNNNNNNIPKKITIKIEVERKTIKQN